MPTFFNYQLMRTRESEGKYSEILIYSPCYLTMLWWRSLGMAFKGRSIQSSKWIDKELIRRCLKCYSLDNAFGSMWTKNSYQNNHTLVRECWITYMTRLSSICRAILLYFIRENVNVRSFLHRADTIS